MLRWGRNISGLNQGENGRSDKERWDSGQSWKIKSVVFATGRHNQAWARGIQIHLAQLFVSLCSGFPRAITSIVNGQIAQKGTAEILEHFLEHLSRYFRKIHRQLRLDAVFLVLESCWFCLTAKFSCHGLPCDLAPSPPHHVMSFASVLSHRTHFFPCPFHLTSLPTLQYTLIGGFMKARATPRLWTVPSPTLTEMAHFACQPSSLLLGRSLCWIPPVIVTCFYRPALTCFSGTCLILTGLVWESHCNRILETL